MQGETPRDQSSVEPPLQWGDDLARALPDLTGAILVVLDVEGRIVFLNRAGLDLSGYTSEEILGRRIWDVLLDPREAEWVRVIADQLVESGASNPLENCWITKDGRHRVIQWSNSVIRDENGEIRFLIGAGVDITGTPGAHDSCKKFRSLQRVNRVGDWEWDFKTDAMRWSDTTFRILGLESGSAEPTFDLFFASVHPEDREEIQIAARQVRLGVTPVYDRHTRVKLPNGEVKTIHIAGEVLFDERRRPRRMAGTVVDITEYKAAERSIRERERDLSIRNRIAEVFLTVRDGEAYQKVLDLARYVTASGEGVFGYRAGGGFVFPASTPRFGNGNVPACEAWQAAVRDLRPVFRECREECGKPDCCRRVLAVPVVFQGTLVAGLVVADKESPYSDLDRRTVELIARYIGPVLDARIERDRTIEDLRCTQTSVDKASDEVYWLDSDGRLHYVNDAVMRNLGYTREELLSMTIFDIDPSLSRETFAGHFLHATTTGSLTFETWHRRKDGSVRPVEISSTHVKLGGHLYSCSFVRDITERKRSEEALRASESRYRQLFEQSSEAIFLHTDEGLIVDVNASACEMLGYDKYELLRMSIWEIVPEQEWGAVQLQRRSLLERGALRFEQRLTGATGETVEAEISVRRLEDGLIQGVARDISKRKRSEAALRQAKEDAEAANAAKSKFMAAMSHEIRTPLNGVIGMAALLLKTKLDADQQESAEVIQSAGGALLSLINDILDVSKIEAGKLDLESVEFNLAGTLHDGTAMAAARAREKGLCFELRLPGDLPQFYGDPGRLRQIVANLADNAVKFTESGGVTVELEAACQGDSRARITISVADTGIGIPAERLGSIFESFTQVDTSITRRYGGTGLGLTISKHLAGKMGGRLGVESEVGAGSRFTFTAEFRTSATDSRKPAPEPVDLAVGREVDPNTRILVVEDNAVNERVVVRFLEQLGYRADIARNGVGALRALESDAYDLVFMDVQMPEMDGFEATRLIRDPYSKVRKHDVPVIAMTAYAMQGDRDRCLAAGMNDHVSKPLAMEQLARAIERWAPPRDPGPEGEVATVAAPATGESRRPE